MFIGMSDIPNVGVRYSKLDAYILLEVYLCYDNNHLLSGKLVSFCRFFVIRNLSV